MNLDIDTMFKLFDVCVLPIAIYGCETWGFENLQVVERLHLKFCKLLLNLKKSTCSAMVYGETGRYPVSLIVYEHMLGFWYRLSNSKVEKLSVQIYRFMFLSQSENPWFVEIRKLLCNHGLNNVWMSQGKNVDFCWLKPKFKQILQDTFQQHWLSEITHSFKWDNYRIFKHSFGAEDYLQTLPDALRIPLVRFRCRNAKVPVEYFYIYNLQDKKCKLCNLNAQGDEFHYVLVCPYFDNERKKLLPRYYWSYPSVHKMSGLFNLGRPHVLKFSKFVNYISRNLTR